MRRGLWLEPHTIAKARPAEEHRVSFSDLAIQYHADEHGDVLCRTWSPSCDVNLVSHSAHSLQRESNRSMPRDLPPRTPTIRRSDDEIYAIARDIRHAVYNRADAAILSLQQELPPPEEQRVEDAVAVLSLLEEAAP